LKGSFPFGFSNSNLLLSALEEDDRGHLLNLEKLFLIKCEIVLKLQVYKECFAEALGNLGEKEMQIPMGNIL